MSKEYQNIDELFKSELGSEAVKAPAYVKENIDKSLFGGRSSKLFFWLIPVAIIAISTPFLLNSLQNESLERGIKLNSGQFLNTKSSNQLTSNFTTDNDYEDLNENVEITDTHINSNTNSETDHENFSNKTVQSVNNKSGSKEKITNSNQIITGNIEKTKIKFDAEIKEENSASLKDEKILSPGNKLIPDEKIAETKTDSLVTENLIAEEKDNELLVEELIIEVDSNIVEKDYELADALLVDSVEVDSSIAIIVKEENEADTTDLIEPTAELEPIKEKRKAWMISLTGGADFKNSNLTATTPELQSIYQNNITDNLGYGISLDARYSLNNGITFGTGLNYSKLSENYSFFKSETQVTDSTYNWIYTQDSAQDSSLVWYYWQDSTQQANAVYSDVEIYNQNGTNSFTYLRIPIHLGYQFNFSRFKIDIYASGRFNLLLRSTVAYLDDANTQIIQSTGAFKNSYFDLQLGTKVHFRLVKNLYLTGLFNYKPPMRSSYYPAGVTNKFQNVHVGLGLSLNL